MKMLITFSKFNFAYPNNVVTFVFTMRVKDKVIRLRCEQETMDKLLKAAAWTNRAYSDYIRLLIDHAHNNKIKL